MDIETIWQGVYEAAKADGESELDASREADAVCELESWKEYMEPFNRGCEPWAE